MYNATTSAILKRIDTASVRRTEAPTVALVVFSESDTAFSGIVRFSASFPVRADAGAQPVTVRDSRGTVVPSRLAESRIEADATLPVGRARWSLTLEFIVENLLADEWRTYGASYEASGESRSDDADLWRTAGEATPASQPPSVYETDCHTGDLPADSTQMADE